MLPEPLSMLGSVNGGVVSGTVDGSFGVVTLMRGWRMNFPSYS